MDSLLDARSERKIGVSCGCPLTPSNCFDRRVFLSRAPGSQLTLFSGCFGFTRTRFLQMRTWLLRAASSYRLDRPGLLPITHDNDDIIERVASIDIGQVRPGGCVRLPMRPPSEAVAEWKDLLHNDPVLQVWPDQLACLG